MKPFKSDIRIRVFDGNVTGSTTSLHFTATMLLARISVSFPPGQGNGRGLRNKLTSRDWLDRGLRSNKRIVCGGCMDLPLPSLTLSESAPGSWKRKSTVGQAMPNSDEEHRFFPLLFSRK